MDNKYLRDQFASQIKAAKDAEIYDNVFLAFGSLLGYVRNRGIIDHDNDMDLGILPYGLDKEHFKAFIRNLRSNGCYNYRDEYRENPVTNIPFWTSIRKYPKDKCWKCCNWFMFEHKGYYWHHKGTDTLIKGIPAHYLELGPYVEFLGQEIRIPKFAGACLDFWYPDWATPRKGGSSFGYLMKVKDWKDKKTWKIHI